MLIVPLSGRMSLRNPPAATIVLILVNCFVFFVYQAGDSRIDEEASIYYFRSGLAVIEIKAYDRYRAGHEIDIAPAEVEGHSLTHGEILARRSAMAQDRDFMEKLDQGRVITEACAIHGLWKEKKDRFREIVSRTTTMTCGFIPADREVRDAFTYMFLHGNFGHLLGNMVFLWLAGCVIELAWGRITFLVLYVAGGILSVALFGVVYHDSTTPLVGASGAIASLMGAYGVLYGMRKIRVFYSLGFYFDYTLVPGFFILGLWIANEFFQLFLGSETTVAYVAHIGGLSGGALMGLVCRRYLGVSGGGASDEDKSGHVSALLDQALKKVEVLDLAGARPVLLRVLEMDPANRAAMTQLFHIDKTSPDTEAFHESSRRLLSFLIRDKQLHRETQAIYQEYIQKAKNPRLPSGLLFSIISYFASTGHEECAEKVVGMLLKKNPDLPKMPQVLLHLARACMKNGLREKARNYLQVICLRYPMSAESTTARRILDDMGS